MVYCAKVQPPTGGVGYRTFAQYEYTLQEKGLRRVSLPSSLSLPSMHMNDTQTYIKNIHDE